jgi:hypothetical protein
MGCNVSIEEIEYNTPKIISTNPNHVYDSDSDDSDDSDSDEIVFHINFEYPKNNRLTCLSILQSIN